jgi:hypothetical protein
VTDLPIPSRTSAPRFPQALHEAVIDIRKPDAICRPSALIACECEQTVRCIPWEAGNPMKETLRFF